MSKKTKNKQQDIIVSWSSDNIITTRDYIITTDDKDYNIKAVSYGQAELIFAKNNDVSKITKIRLEDHCYYEYSIEITPKYDKKPQVDIEKMLRTIVSICVNGGVPCEFDITTKYKNYKNPVRLVITEEKTKK